MNSAKEYSFEKNSLIITSSGAKSRGWLDYLKVKDYYLFDSVKPNPSMETVEKILSEYKQNFSSVIGLGGGSSLDVAKFVANKLKIKKF